MNDYRITYVTKDDQTFTQTITERNEVAAKKRFTVQNRGLGLTATGIELISENTCATKQQERDALAAIKKMVEELGPQSYLAMAFEGCFEDAEQNIENDWGCSQKQLADAATKKVEELEKKIEELEKELKAVGITAELNERDLREAIKTAKEKAFHTITTLRQQILTPDDLTDIKQLVSEKRSEFDDAAAKAAEEVVRYADNPTSAEFIKAVKDHRTAKSNTDYYNAIIGRLMEVEKATQQDIFCP